MVYTLEFNSIPPFVGLGFAMMFFVLIVRRGVVYAIGFTRAVTVGGSYCGSSDF